MASNINNKVKKKKKATMIPYPTEESFEPICSSSYYQDGDEEKSMVFQEKQQKQKQPMIIKSIQEKKYKKNKILEKSNGNSNNKNETNNNNKPSRFAQQQQHHYEKEKGFPSFQIPIGALAKQNNKHNARNKETIHLQPIKSPSMSRERASEEEKEERSSNSTSSKKITSSAKDDVDESYKIDNISRINNMSKEDINESINEIESSLSSTSLQFLKHRHNKKKKKQNTTTTITTNAIKTKSKTMEKATISKCIKEEEEVVNSNTLSNNKEEESMTSVNNTPFDEHRGIIEGNGNDITNYTTLLRSTSFLQRSLAIKYIFDTYKQKQENSNDNSDDCYYPIMLPMSLRFILHETISSKNKNPTVKIMQYHALYTLNHLVINFSNLEYAHFVLDCNSTLWKSIFVYPTIDILPHTPHCKQTQPPYVSTTTATTTDSTAKTKVLEECQLFYKNPVHALTTTQNMNILKCFVDILLSQSSHDNDENNVTSSTTIHDDNYSYTFS